MPAAQIEVILARPWLFLKLRQPVRVVPGSISLWEAARSEGLKGGFVQILRQSQCVKHGQYGIGFVTESNSERTTIEFDEHGKMKFVTSLMVVELMAGEARAKSATPKRRKKPVAAPAAVPASSS